MTRRAAAANGICPQCEFLFEDHDERMAVECLVDLAKQVGPYEAGWNDAIEAVIASTRAVKGCMTVDVLFARWRALRRQPSPAADVEPKPKRKRTARKGRR